jgi:hypothetical protein
MLRFSVLAVLVLAFAVQSLAKVELVQGDNKIDVKIDGKLVTSYLYKPDMTKPVLYPVYSPAGTLLNRRFPFEQVEGETKDHPHHFGIFLTYDDVNKEGFWNNTKTPPQIKMVNVTEQKSGKTAQISSILHWVARSGKTYLEEKRTMVFSGAKNYYTIDFDVTLTAKDTAVVFGDTKEGMFAMRMADWMAEKNGHSTYFSSNGDKTEKDIWGKRAAWVSLQGEKDGKTQGVAMMNHPASVNYPTFWHARAYGLFAANPLGQKAFEEGTKVANPKAFNLTLPQGASTVIKFRVVVYDGSMDTKTLEKIYKNYVK